MQHPATAPRTDTRSRVQKVALELFAEQGYEKTSLREIAERLGVTKAALYYHFKSKEDIVHSLTDDHYAQIDELIEWAKAQPSSEQRRREILDRYVRIVFGGAEVFRFIEQNRAAMQAMEQSKGDRLARFRSRLDALVELLAGPDAPVRERVRATAALITASATCHVVWDEADPAELQSIALEIAADLIGLYQSTDAGRDGPFHQLAGPFTSTRE
jgi:AcrR family transcriptional regulator